MQKYLTSRSSLVVIFICLIGAVVNLSFSQYISWATRQIQLIQADQRFFILGTVAYSSLILVFYFTQGKVKARFESQLDFDLKRDILAATFAKTSKKIEQLGESKITHYLINDVQFMITNYFFPWCECVAAILQIILGLVLVGRKSWFLTGMILLLTAIALLFPKRMSQKVSQENAVFQVYQGMYLQRIIGIFSRFTPLVKKGLTEHFHEDSLSSTKGYRQKLFVARKTYNFSLASLNSANQIITILLIMIMVFQVQTGDLTISEFTGFIFLINNLVSPFFYFATLLNQIKGTKGVAAELEAYLTKQPPVSDVPLKLEAPTIEINQLAVCYGTTEIIKIDQLRFEFPKKYLITGPSGSGKSTLLNVLLQELPLEPTQVIIGSQELGEIPEKQLGQLVFACEQRPILFAGTIFDNITLFKELPLEKVTQTMEELGLAKFIPMMKQTSIDELSGGEQQRVCLARSLCTTAPILLFDEPTSNQDPALGRLVEARLLQEPRTVIVISHQVNQENLAAYDVRLRVEGKTFL